MVSRRRTWDCVVVDLNTQFDFCDTRGGHPVRNTRTLVPSLHRVVAWTRYHGVPIISAIDTHRTNEINVVGVPEFCLDGTNGHRKLPFTVLKRSVSIDGDNTLCVPTDLFREYQQVIFPKRTVDLLSNPKADRFLTQLPISEFILCGVSLEFSVKALGLALLARGRRVKIVRDACGFWTEPEADMSLRLLDAKGARIIEVRDLVARPPKRNGYIPSALWLERRNGNGNGNGHRPKSSNGALPHPDGLPNMLPEADDSGWGPRPDDDRP